jgi:hypothetical protein
MTWVRKDITGHVFGRLTVLKFIRREKRKNTSLYYYDFQCKCGTVKSIEISDVRRGHTVSCGCFVKENNKRLRRHPEGHAALNGLFNTYKRKNAIHQRLPFELTKDQFTDLVSSKCFYCQKPPAQIKRSKVSFFIYNGIDRVDNSQGYSVANCVPSCGYCNTLKGGITLTIIQRVIDFLKGNVTHVL